MVKPNDEPTGGFSAFLTKEEADTILGFKTEGFEIVVMIGVKDKTPGPGGLLSFRSCADLSKKQTQMLAESLELTVLPGLKQRIIDMES